jgi:hypothetical protein
VVEGKRLVCVRCGRAIERCMFCEQVECADPLCYPDMVIVLGMSAPPLHLHGG